jgi:hypothetical protein
MGIGSLFVLSLGLSVLVEVVRMLNGWERRESRQGGLQAEPCRQGALRRSGGSTPTSAGSGAEGCWFFVGSRGRFGSLGAPIGAPKGAPKWS